VTTDYLGNIHDRDSFLMALAEECFRENNPKRGRALERLVRDLQAEDAKREIELEALRKERDIAQEGLDEATLRIIELEADRDIMLDVADDGTRRARRRHRPTELPTFSSSNSRTLVEHHHAHNMKGQTHDTDFWKNTNNKRIDGGEAGPGA
jgi:hypothetical protein